MDLGGKWRTYYTDYRTCSNTEPTHPLLPKDYGTPLEAKRFIEERNKEVSLARECQERPQVSGRGEEVH